MLPLSSWDHLGEYYHSFFDLASYLKDASKLTDQEISQLFTHRFPISFCIKVQECLVQKHPVDHHPDDPYTLKEIYNAAQWILSGGLPMLLSTSTMVPVCKSEPSDTQTLIQVMMAALIPTITQSMAQSITPLIQQLSSSNQTTSANAVCTLLCLFCGLIDHHIGNCPKAEDYINTGKCKQVNGKLQLPDGMELGCDLPGYNFQQKINNWFTMNPNMKTVPISEQNHTAHPCTAVGLWKVSKPSTSQYHWAEQAQIEEVPMEDENTNTLESNIKVQEDKAILAAAQAVIEKQTMGSASKNIKFDSPPACPFTGNPVNHTTLTSTSALNNPS